VCGCDSFRGKTLRQGKLSIQLSDLDFVLIFGLICLDIYIIIGCYRLSDLDCILNFWFLLFVSEVVILLIIRFVFILSLDLYEFFTSILDLFLAISKLA
jgi:hypothetical protein